MMPRPACSLLRVESGIVTMLLLAALACANTNDGALAQALGTTPDRWKTMVRIDRTSYRISRIPASHHTPHTAVEGRCNG